MDEVLKMKVRQHAMAFHDLHFTPWFLDPLERLSRDPAELTEAEVSLGPNIEDDMLALEDAVIAMDAHCVADSPVFPPFLARKLRHLDDLVCEMGTLENMGRGGLSYQRYCNDRRWAEIRQLAKEALHLLYRDNDLPDGYLED